MNVTDEMTTGMAKVTANLQALEFVLRLFLYESVGPKDPDLRFERLSAGDVVLETPLTNYDSLGEVIKKVNRRLEAIGRPERIDKSLVDVRDAFAHGRILADRPEGPFRLVKFCRPSAGTVKVAESVDLTPDWLDLQWQRTCAEVRKVVELDRSLGLAAFPPD